jgi:hypothetical protein
MAIQMVKDMSILVGSLQMAGNAKDVSLSVEVTPLDTTALSTTGWTSVVGGLKSGSVAIGEFMQDVAVGSVDDTLYPLLGTAGVVKSICTGSADGSPAYLLQSIPLTYTALTGAVGELAKGAISGSSSTGPVVRGMLIHPSNVSRTSSGTGTGRQLGAVAAGKKVYAALHVVSASGTSPTLDVIVQSDDNADFTSPTTRLTFTQATGRTSQMVSLAGAVTDTYWRVSYTIGGSDTPTFAFAVTAGIL